MPFKPNYRQQRNERTRAKELKAAEKQRRREEDADRKKDDVPGAPVPEASASEEQS
jgi:hypothetical protein